GQAVRICQGVLTVREFAHAADLVLVALVLLVEGRGPLGVPPGERFGGDGQGLLARVQGGVEEGAARKQEEHCPEDRRAPPLAWHGNTPLLRMRTSFSQLRAVKRIGRAGQATGGDCRRSESPAQARLYPAAGAGGYALVEDFFKPARQGRRFPGRRFLRAGFS